MLKNISGQIRDVDILDPETRQACFKVATQPVIPQTTQTIITTVSVCAEQYPELIAAKDQFGAEVTYQQLVERIVTISTSLQAMEVGTGTRVGLLGPPTTDLLSTHLCNMFARCSVHSHRQLRVGRCESCRRRQLRDRGHNR
jgi:non-ribosomal peptide synthetase component F